MLLKNDVIVDDSKHDYLIVVPTIGDPDVLIPTFHSLIRNMPPKTKLMLSFNPVNSEQSKSLLTMLNGIQIPATCSFDYHWEDAPVGFGAAVNLGLLSAIKKDGLPKYTIIFNDDARATDGWIEGMVAALETKHVNFATEPPDPTTNRRKDRPVELYGKIGMVGPVSDNVAGVQRVGPTSEVNKIGYDLYAHNHHNNKFNTGQRITTQFLSGFVLCMKQDFVKDLMLDDGTNLIGLFDEENFPIGGYEDNDLCVRADIAGWRLIIAFDTFVGHLGHQSFDKHFQNHMRGMKNRLNFYKKWQPFVSGEDKIIGNYRVKMTSINDLHVWKTSLIRHAELIDGFAVLMTNNPLEIMDGNDWEDCKGSLSQRDQQLLKECGGVDSFGVAKAVQSWIFDQTRESRKPEVVVQTWVAEFNERDERNLVIDMAENMGATWIMSIDHDEMLEDRIRRRHLDRMMNHPNPMVDSWELGWLNHWDTARTTRIDMPWGDGATYTGGMRGCRFWRVKRGYKARISGGTANGLHCGNCPDSSNMSRRHSALRFRHFGYVRAVDRIRKFHDYQTKDPNPDSSLTGGSGYGHLINEEKMIMRPFMPQNGIGMHMLVYEKESPDDIARWLDDVHGLMDRIVLVWTGEWDSLHLEMNLDTKDWPTTGPSRELATFAAMHGVEWIHKPLNKNISAARSAGIEYLHQYRNEGLGWAVFFDPDEMFEYPNKALASIRELALCTDTWGWLFTFLNPMKGGGSSKSESVRMSKLDHVGIMRMNGRVHESFNDAVKMIQNRGEHPNFRYAPFNTLNMGLYRDRDELYIKLKSYYDMCVLDLEDNPYNPGAWVTLGLQYNNDGNPELAKACFERGVMCAGTSYLPFRELGLYHLRIAKALMSEVMKYTTFGHEIHKVAEKTFDFLQMVAPGQPYVGTGRNIIGDQPLPDFPFDELIENEESNIDADNGTSDSVLSLNKDSSQSIHI